MVILGVHTMTRISCSASRRPSSLVSWDAVRGRRSPLMKLPDFFLELLQQFLDLGKIVQHVPFELGRHVRCLSFTESIVLSDEG